MSPPEPLDFTRESLPAHVAAFFAERATVVEIEAGCARRRADRPANRARSLKAAETRRGRG